MSFKSDLYEYLKADADVSALVGTRIYPEFAPEKSAKPFIVFRKINNKTIHHLGAPASLNQDDYEFDTVSTTAIQAEDLGQKLRLLLDGYTGVMNGNTNVRRMFQENYTDVVASPQNGTDEVLYTVSLNYSIWYQHSTSSYDPPTPTPQPTVNHLLGSHLDVTITSVTDEEVLTYDSATGKWINKPGGGAPDAHASTHITGASDPIQSATNSQNGLATSAHITAIEANTAKETNVPTALSVGTLTDTTVAITSDGGADDVTLPAVVASTSAGVMSGTDKAKLDGIEALADVTDSTNVESAGAVMESDTTTVNMSFVVDEDDMVSDSDTKVPTQQSVKAFVEASVLAEDFWDKTGTTLSPKTAGDGISVDAGAVFNSVAGDNDFTGNKRTSGQWINYDAEDDKISLDGNFEAVAPDENRGWIQFDSGSGSVWGGGTITVAGQTSLATATLVSYLTTTAGYIGLRNIVGDFQIGELLDITGGGKNGQTINVVDYKKETILMSKIVDTIQNKSKYLFGATKAFDVNTPTFPFLGEYTFFVDNGSFDIVSTGSNTDLRIIKEFSGNLLATSKTIALGWEGTDAYLSVSNKNMMRFDPTFMLLNPNAQDINLVYYKQTSGAAINYDAGLDTLAINSETIITSAGATKIPLTIKADASQSVGVLTLTNSSDTELTRFDEQGRLGINTTGALQSYFEISGIEGSQMFRFNNLTGGTSDWILGWETGFPGYNITEAGVATARFFIQDGGNVGIHTNTPTEVLDVNGNFKTRAGRIEAITTKVADYTATSADHNIVADGTSNTVTITLPASPTTGQVLNISCLNSTFSVDIDFNGKNYYDSAANENLYKGSNVRIIYDGAQWVGA